VLLLHDNARLHTVALTQQKLEKMKWTTLDHHPYSPNLALCDYYLFRPLKEALGEQRFDDDHAVETFVSEWLMTQPTSFYQKGIENLPRCWEKCISKLGDYVKN